MLYSCEKPYPTLHEGRQRRCASGEHAGFSLIELLVVVAILAVLAAIAIPLFLNQKQKANDGAIVSDLKTLANDLSSSLLVDTAVVTAGGDGNPLSNSGNVTVDGVARAKNGASVFADTSVLPKRWCVSEQSASGKIFVASSSNTANRGVYEATGPCTSAASVPAAGVNTNGTIVSYAGNLVPAVVAEGDDASLITAARATVVSSTDTAASGTKSFKFTVTNTVGGVYAVPSLPASSWPAVRGDTNYTFQMNFKSGGATPNAANVAVDWYNSSGGFISSSNGAPTPVTSSSWTVLTATLKSPSTAAYARYYVVNLAGPYNIGDVAYTDKIGVWEGSGGQWAPPGQPIYQ